MRILTGSKGAYLIDLAIKHEKRTRDEHDSVRKLLFTVELHNRTHANYWRSMNYDYETIPSKYESGKDPFKYQKRKGFRK